MAMIRINHRRVTKDQLAVNVLGYILVGLFALLCVIPFYLIIVASFTDESSLIRCDGRRDGAGGIHRDHDGICAVAQGFSVAQ